MVSSITDRRAKVLADVEEQMARRSEMPEFEKNDSESKLISLEFKDHKPTIIVTGLFKNLTPKMYDWYMENVLEHCTKVDKANVMVQLEAHDDHKIVHQRIMTPVMVGNRSMIQTMWKDYNPEGVSIYCSTTKGNEALYEKYAKEMGKDVIAECHFAY